jgi:toxin ParE1/3/4
MRIVWTDPAIADLTAIREYIARDSEQYATQFVGRIIEVVEKLLSFPELGRKVPESRVRDHVRELLFQNYRVVYRVVSEKIQIITVIHGARDLRRMKPKPWDVI